MKEGDIIEWRGANKVYRGTVITSEIDPEGYVVQLDNGCTFPLRDLRSASSAKLIEV